VLGLGDLRETPSSRAKIRFRFLRSEEGNPVCERVTPQQVRKLYTSLLDIFNSKCF